MKSNKNNRWSNLYIDYINKEFKNWDEYFNIKMKLKKKFLKKVLKYSKNGKPVLECGCGTGKFSAYIASMGIITYAIDKETAMVENTKKISEKISPNNKVNVIHANIKNIPFENDFFSVTHSSGVFEHYSDDNIVKLINEQLRVSNVCIFSVPSPYFERKMFDDERFMNRKKWREIILRSNAEIIEETGYHYKTFMKRIYDIIKKPKSIFKPIALFVFVLKEKENIK